MIVNGNQVKSVIHNGKTVQKIIRNGVDVYSTELKFLLKNNK